MIPFTQFLRPNGRRAHVEIERPADVEALAKELLAQRCRFEIEELMTGKVSMTVEQAGNEDFGPVSIQICDNGPKVPETVDVMIREAHQHLKDGTYPPKEEEDDAE